MKSGLYSFILSLMMVMLAAGAFAAAQDVEAPKPAPAATTAEAPEMTEMEKAADHSRFNAIKLPEKDSPDYWVVRSDAITELTRLLTSKRAEMKQKRQMLADYLLSIGKGEEMASKQIKVPDDPKLYLEALGLEDLIKDKDLDAPLKTPTWEELAEFAMRFIIDEGYVPMQFDSTEDAASFIQVAKQKEQYAQKVRKEMRNYVEDALKIWIYLGQINQQSSAKEWVVQIKLDAEAAKNADRAALADQRRMANLDRMESEKERKFADAQRRASYSSQTRERRYNSRDSRLQYQQTLLADRYTRSYRW